MNCTDARPHLPALLYGDLAPAEARAVEQHLAGCPACRQQYAELRQLRRALDAVPAPSVQVDLPAVYREAAARQARQARRWRRAALACAALAALVLLAFGLRLQVRVDAHQFVLRWGDVPEVTAPSPPSRAEESPALADLERRLQLASSLIHALADDVEARDAHQQELLKRLQRRLDAHQLQDNARWNEARRDIAALYTAQFGSPGKGE
jgi:hypothetical protein